MSPGLTNSAVVQRRPGLTARLVDYAELSKPRIVALELVAVLVAAHVASGYGVAESPWSLPLLVGLTVGVGLVAASANAVNQWVERERDALMPRTRNRPLPAGRVSPVEAITFGAASLTLGALTLAATTGPAPTLVALATWFVYVGVYTPLKPRTWLNTAVGAVSGATPLWIGWTAGGGQLTDPLALVLVGVMYLWQFPHFMAIAWLCRHDYELGGYQMSTRLDPSGWWAGVQAVVGSAVMLPASLAAVLASPSLSSSSAGATAYAAVVGLAGVGMLAASGAFLARRGDRSARRLLRASLLYVPVWLLTLWLVGA